MWRFVRSTGIGILLLLGVFTSSYGFDEIKEWKPIWYGGSPTSPYQDANGDLWVVYGGALYHLKKEQIEKSTGDIPLAEVEKRSGVIPFSTELRELVVVGPSKGWAISTQPLRILEYDGVFWNVVQGIGGVAPNGFPLISVVSENEVWFGNGYRYINGRYEKFSENSFFSIKMQDSQNGLAVRYSDNILTVFSGGQWIDTGFRVKPTGATHDKSGNILFLMADGYGNIYRLNKASLPRGVPDTLLTSDAGDVQVDPEGGIWFSTGYDLQHLDPTTLAVIPADSSSRWRSSGTINGVPSMQITGGSTRHIIAITSRYILIWFDGIIYKGSFVFPSLLPIQDIHLDAVPANELPEVNTQTRREFFIKNKGDGILKVASIKSSSSMFRFQAEQTTKGGSAFDFSQNKGWIPAGDSLRVVVVYFPTEPGQHNGRLVIESNDRTNPTYTINLSGATLGSVGPRISVTSALQFDSTLADQAQRSTLRIRNSGRGFLAVRSISSNNPAFKVSGDTLLIPPLTSRSVEVVFSPAVGGENKGQITILSDDPVSPEVKVALIGTGVVVPEGPITLDSYLAAGDQRRRVVGNAVPGMVYTFQLNVADAPEIQGWSATIEYDPRQVRYVKDSFQASSFIPGLVTLVDENEGGISVGGTVLGSDARKSGNGALGTLSFEVQEGFKDSTYLVIREVSFRRVDGVGDKRAVWSVATITWEPMAGPLRGDFNGDDAVSFDDFFLFADGFGSTDPLLDLNGNGAVDFDDFFLFADNFGTEARAKLMVLAHQYLGLPTAPRLEQNYPNPFNPATAINYSLPETSTARITVYSLSGQVIRTLVHDVNQAPGNYRVIWDGQDENGQAVASGVYFYRFEAVNRGFVETKRMILLR